MKMFFTIQRWNSNAAYSPIGVIADRSGIVSVIFWGLPPGRFPAERIYRATRSIIRSTL